MSDYDDVDYEKGPTEEELIATVLEIQPKLGHSALLGGLAMHFFGSDRFTKDVDFAALSLRGTPEESKPLTFGGRRFRAPNGVKVDVIVRNDDYDALYIAAIASARTLKIKDAFIRTVTREFLAVIKLVAGRDKDIIDLKFLLTQEGFSMEATLELAYAYIGNYGAQELRQYQRIALWEKETNQ